MGCVEPSTGEALSSHPTRERSVSSISMLKAGNWRPGEGKCVVPNTVASGGAGPGSQDLAGHPATCHRGRFLSRDGHKPLRFPVIFCSILDNAIALSH